MTEEIAATTIPEQNENSEEQIKTEPVEFIRDPILDTEEMKKIFVGGIPSDATEDELKEFFKEHNEGNEVGDNVIVKKDTDKKSTFGFIVLESSELVDKLLLKKKDLTFKGRLLDVKRAVPKNSTHPGAHEKTKKLFIANLPKHNCSEDDVRKYFEARHPEEFGTIETITLIKNKNDESVPQENKGYGFITVTNEDMADKMAIQHALFEFGGRRIELKKSVTNNSEGRKNNYNKGGFYNQRGGAAGGYGGGYGEYDMYGGYGYGYGQYGPPGGWYGYDQGMASGGGGYGRGGGGGARGRGGRYQPY